MHPRFPIEFAMVGDAIPKNSPIFRNMKITMVCFGETASFDKKFCFNLQLLSRELNSGQMSIIPCNFGHWMLEAMQDKKFSDLKTQVVFEKMYLQEKFHSKKDIYALERRKCFRGAVMHSTQSTFFARDVEELKIKENKTLTEFVAFWDTQVRDLSCRPSTYNGKMSATAKVSLNPAVPPYLNVTLAVLGAVGFNKGGMGMLDRFFSTTIYVWDQTPDFKHLICHK
jgi:hypothetical protein